MSKNNLLGATQKEIKNSILTKSNISTKNVEIQKQLILSGELFSNKKLKITIIYFQFILEQSMILITMVFLIMILLLILAKIKKQTQHILIILVKIRQAL